ncbi:MAG: multicopper oxidase family protein [Gammaproteobacteria bacterium]|nr:multicopper oxidase family protein [Gammaproteobacteria bacterium]
MNVSRRRFLAGSAALALAGAAPRIAAPGEVTPLRAAPGSVRLAPPGYPETPVWGYEGGVPGPVLRAAQGERFTRRFVNDLPQPSTIHWHGIRIANAMDGVPDLTQAAVPPGGEFLYDFVVPDAGTYWYHPHQRTWEQMARGLYGALIVEEHAPPLVDRDEVLLIDDWRLAEDARIQESFGAMMDLSHAGRIGNWVTVNGSGEFRLSVTRHERLRLRLVNTANARIFSLGLQGMEGWIVALDGQPLDEPAPADRMTLAPAQRADLIADVTGEEGAAALLVSFERDGTHTIATLNVAGIERPVRLPAPAALPANPVPPLGDLARARRVMLHMEGGAMGGMREAVMDGQTTDIRQLVQAGLVWAMNGVAADLPREPLIAASRGETVRISMVNDTAWPHGMHLHGHHFRRLHAGGRPGPLRDTVLIDRGDTTEIAFHADNPGRWLLHCHMLEHAASGMRTWLEVTG